MTDALAYFSAKLTHETDASDVYGAQRDGSADFVLVDVRDDAAWAQGHAVGAVHLPRRDVASRARTELGDVDVVVYCWSPGCNGGAKAAVEFAQLGYRVREMIGGFEYWAREGYPIENARGPLPRHHDPLVALVRT
ncbi:rhodanese-like domain-containing protein [Microbacterium radiodurans]|uniref:Sulfurtransferase n=1 Tax=Microbacterium radiodurans TaxID=661398 RepID=A0A5J5IU14_9MICO|nr:rhodanese-like domain-containing protein [Microbacterium radiodurans]KAA9087153.1 sulfurtransferase [Microbacterium radiodurans]